MDEKNIEVTILGNSVHIHSQGKYMFVYNEYENGAWLGGLQCNYANDSKEYKSMEFMLKDIAKLILTIDKYGN